jgi:hypothetical protein
MRLLLIDGLAYGAMPAEMIAGFGRPVVELCHHPLALEPGLARPPPRGSGGQRAGGHGAGARVIVTGPHTADRGRADLACPEQSPSPCPARYRRRARGSGRPVPHLLAVGSVIPRKAYDVLVQAMARLATCRGRSISSGRPFMRRIRLLRFRI